MPHAICTGEMHRYTHPVTFSDIGTQLIILSSVVISWESGNPVVTNYKSGNPHDKLDIHVLILCRDKLVEMCRHKLHLGHEKLVICQSAVMKRLR